MAAAAGAALPAELPGEPLAAVLERFGTRAFEHALRWQISVQVAIDVAHNAQLANLFG